VAVLEPEHASERATRSAHFCSFAFLAVGVLDANLETLSGRRGEPWYTSRYWHRARATRRHRRGIWFKAVLLDRVGSPFEQDMGEPPCRSRTQQEDGRCAHLGPALEGASGKEKFRHGGKRAHHRRVRVIASAFHRVKYK